MSECIYCGATDDEGHGIVVGIYGGLNENVCNICRADYLAENTTLSQREAEVAALKQLTGATHARIAEILDLDKSTVDEYSRRLNAKAEKANTTAVELSEFY